MLTGGKPPDWAAVLLAAEDWGVPPWEVSGDNDRITWFYRWLSFKHWRSKAEQAQMKRAARRSKHG